MATVSTADAEGGAIRESDPIAALAHAPDHALAISAAAYLDRALAALLVSRFQQLSAEEHRLLFEVGGGSNGILARFSSKILISHAAGHLSRDRCDDLMLIDHIAQMFAQSHVVLTFSAESVHQSCMQFSPRRSKPSVHQRDGSAREIYYDVVVDLYVDIWMTIRGDLAWSV